MELIKSILITLLLSFFCPVFGQDVLRITVVDEREALVPYVHVVNSRTGQIFLTDEAGVLRFKDFPDEKDTFVFQSIFYEQLRYTGAELRAMERIVLPAKKQEIESIAVTPGGYAEKQIKNLSTFFSQHYSKDYASLMTHLRTVECNGLYREFVGYQGVFTSFNFSQKEANVFLDDGNQMDNWAPLTMMRSDPFEATGVGILENCSINTSSTTEQWNKEALLIKYNNYGGGGAGLPSALIAKRSLEMYSPLNPKQLNNFEYRVVDTQEGGDLVVIHFRTRDEAYPRKTRIFGQGLLYYRLSNKLIEKIVMENHQDSFTMFPRKLQNTLLPSATQHRLEVNYTMQDGHIYTKSIAFLVNWIDPMQESGFYHIRLNSRRNPIKNKLREYEYIEFSRMVPLDKEQKKEVKGMLMASGQQAYCAPFIREKWENLPLLGIDRQRLERELNINGKTLYEQAEANGLFMEYYYPTGTPAAIERFKNYHNLTRRIIYPLIYNEFYE